MAKKNYDQLVDQIVGLIGGKDNISFFTHCVTRLRFSVKDKGRVKADEIEKLPGVIGIKWAGEQFQVVIGPDVADVYQMISEKEGIGQQENSEVGANNEKKKFSLNMILDSFSGAIAPIIPVIMSAGLVKVVVFLLNMAGILPAESSTYLVLSALGDAGYYFLPVFLGYGAAKKFGANVGLGMYIGALFIHPTLSTAISEGGVTLFGLPVYATSYSSSIFPVIITIAIMAPVEKFIGKKSPTIVRSMVQPLLTVLIITPIALLITGPLGALIGTYLSAFIMFLYNYLGSFAIAILAAIYPLMVMTGMHSGLTPYMVSAVAAGGDLVVLPAICVANLCQGAASFAVALKTKDETQKSNAVSAGVTAFIGGVTEPALFGVILPLKKPLIGVMAGSFVGGFLMGILHVTYLVFGGGGLFAIPSFIGEAGNNVVFAVISMIVGIVVSFVVTFILMKKESK